MKESDNSRIKVLVVDDSAVIRTMFTEMLNSAPDIEVIGTAVDPYVARDKLVNLNPDVMTLDIQMPKMDGITFLKKVMEHMPTRTVIISSFSKTNPEMGRQALEAGAIEVLEKPVIDRNTPAAEVRERLITVVRSAAKARLKSGPGKRRPVADSPRNIQRRGTRIIAIASSTGGTDALKRVLPQLPDDTPGIVVVQHMPPGFTESFAIQLNKICQIEVREARQNDVVRPGLALIAPGNFHMEIRRGTQGYLIHLHQQPLLHGVRPAADFLMNSVAKHAGSGAIGVVLTGMGKDGGAGLLRMKQKGSYNLAQDQESAVVYGMPGHAKELGAIDQVLPLDQIAMGVVEAQQHRERRKA